MILNVLELNKPINLLEASEFINSMKELNQNLLDADYINIQNKIRFLSKTARMEYVVLDNLKGSQVQLFDIFLKRIF